MDTLLEKQNCKIFDFVRNMKVCNFSSLLVTFNSLMAIAVEKKEEPVMLCQQLLREMKKMKIGNYFFCI